MRFVDIKSSFGKQTGEHGFQIIIKRKKHTEKVRTGLSLLRDMRACLNKQTRASKKTTKSLFVSRKRNFAALNDNGVIIGYISLKPITPHLVEISDFAMKDKPSDMTASEHTALTHELFETFTENVVFNYGIFDKAIFYNNTQSRLTRMMLYGLGWTKEAKLENHFMPDSNVHIFSKMLFRR